jgi:hypothetical protein
MENLRVNHVNICKSCPHVRVGKFGYSCKRIAPIRDIRNVNTIPSWCPLPIGTSISAEGVITTGKVVKLHNCSGCVFNVYRPFSHFECTFLDVRIYNEIHRNCPMPKPVFIENKF